jgi:outer membrane protein assembly factor BamB
LPTVGGRWTRDDVLRRLCCLIVFSRFALLGADWPAFLGPSGTGVSPETNLLDELPPGGPKILFDLPIGAGYAAPSVKAGRLILFQRLGGEEVVTAMDAATGRELWRSASPSAFRDPYGYNNGPRSAPLIDGDRVFVFGAEGRLRCLAFSDGREIWSRDTSRDWNVPEAFFGVGSSPVMVDGKLIVMVGGQPNSGVVALDPGTGRTLWESVGEASWAGQPMVGWPGNRTVAWRTWEKQASYSSPVAATMNGRRLLLCLMRQGLAALDPETGAVKFSRWFRAPVDESVNAANPVVWNDQVFISSAYYRTGSVLLRANPGNTNFSEVWRGLGLEMHWSTPILVDGFLYGFSGRNEPDAHLRCIDAQTGEVKWDRDEHWEKHSAEQPALFGRGSFIFAEHKLVAVGEGGLVGIFRPNPAKCEEVSRWQVPSLHFPCWAGPVLSDGRLFLRSEDRLVCLGFRRQ